MPDLPHPQTPAISVVIPVHDESGAILPLLTEVQAALHHVIDHEVIVVDDGSRDATPLELESAGSALPALRVITHAERRGQSSALDAGIRAARAPWIATLDGDGQNDPSDLRGLWDQRRADPEIDLLCGIRVTRHDNARRRMASRIANVMRNAVLHDHVPDTGCGLKMIRRETYLALPRFDHMHRFLPALVLAAGGRVRTAPVHHRPRAAGRSKYGIVDRLGAGVLDLLGVWWLRHRMLNRTHLEAQAVIDEPNACSDSTPGG